MSAIPWMQKGPFGLMVHYLSHICPREGQETRPFDEMVEEFNVPRLVEQIRSTGAKWLILPLGQNTGRYIAPNAHMDLLLPGACTRRDLFADISNQLYQQGIRTIAYLPSEVDSAPLPQRQAFGWDLDPCDKQIFQDHWMKVIREWSLRYGSLIQGWWFDGCYVAKEKPFLRTREWDNRRFDVTSWMAALKAGNPQSVWSMNSGVNDDRHEGVFPQQDYLAGEANHLAPLPEGPIQDGLQWHALTWIDCFWMHEKPGPMPTPRFTDEALFSFVCTCHERGGAVTLNIGIYRDGSLADASLEQIQRLGRVMSI